jgi:hypothetical protein
MYALRISSRQTVSRVSNEIARLREEESERLKSIIRVFRCRYYKDTADLQRRLTGLFIREVFSLTFCQCFVSRSRVRVEILLKLFQACIFGAELEVISRPYSLSICVTVVLLQSGIALPVLENTCKMLRMMRIVLLLAGASTVVGQ